MDVIELSDSDDTIILTPPKSDEVVAKVDDIADRYLSVNLLPEENPMELDSDEDLPSFKLLKSSAVVPPAEDAILNDLKRKYNRKSPLEKEELRQQKAKEKQTKKEEAEREKALKKAQEVANKNMKRGECMKFVTVQIDAEMLKEPYSSSLLQELQSAEISFRIESQIFPQIITWTREIQSHLMNDEGKLILSSENQQTDNILLVIKCKEFIEFVSKNELSTHIQTIKSVLVDQKMFLIVYGLREYFRYWRNEKQREFRSQITENDVQKPPKGSKFYATLPKVSSKTVEYALTELELFHKVSHKFIDTPVEFSSTLIQVTKAVAQKPLKAQQAEKYQYVEWFAPGDNKNCVKVDKDGVGLKRLWNQTLTMFPLVRLETAEAIVQKYPNPSSLWTAYESCNSEKDKEMLLQDIQIRRAAGPLSSVRRIGPELSKKIYKFYTSLEGDTLL